MVNDHFHDFWDNSEELFKAVVCQSGEGITICNHSGQYLFVNDAFCKMTGYSAGEFSRMTVRDFIPPETELKLFNKVVNQQPGTREVELVRKNGERFWVEAKGYPIQFKGQSLVLVSIRNISGRKSIERQLKESEEKFRAAFQNSPNAVNLNRASDGMYIEINQGFTNLMGYTPEEVIGKTSLELNIWKNKDDREKVVEQLLENGLVDNYETEFFTKTGEVKIGQMSARMVDIGGEKFIVSNTRDITSLRTSEDALTLLNFAINHINEGVFLIHESGHIAFINDAACLSLGYDRSELVGMTIPQIDPDFSADDWSKHWKALSEGESFLFETVHQRKDGQIFPVEIATNRFRYQGQLYSLALSRDISERKRNEEERLTLVRQMEQAQKLESLGVLAGGIAHDFNNLLTVIMGNAELSVLKLPPESGVRNYLNQILKASEGASELAKQMLAYSGRGQFVIEPLQLNSLFDDMMPFIKTSIGPGVALDCCFDSELPQVEADEKQLRQVIMNLIINSSEAIGNGKGAISITTGRVECSGSAYENTWLPENLTVGNYVFLEIADTGSGMDKTTLEKLFDPFFTTKFTGRGLGMSATLGIVRGHGGAIQVDSEIDQGTRFRVLLPAAGEMLKIQSQQGLKKKPTHDVGTVLLVDDEPIVRATAAAMLEEIGCKYLTAGDGVEALNVYKEKPEIGLVILDLTMPKMDGVQCFRELKKLNPELKIIIASGYSAYDVSQKFSGADITGMIQKPYKLAALRDLIQKEVDAKKS